jgi:ribonuclease R
MDDQEVFDFVSPGNVLGLIRERGPRGVTLRMLVARVVDELGVSRSEARQLLRESLRDLVREGRVVEGRGKRYSVAEATDLIPGTLRRQPAGFALVREADPRAKPIRIDPRHLRGALDGDRVLVKLESARRRARAEGVREGVVVRILERHLDEVVGRWMADRGRPCLKPLDRRLRFVLVPTASRLDSEPRHGDYLVASVESVSPRGLRARGVLLERLGRLGDPGLEEAVVLRTHGIPVEFPDQAIAEAEDLPDVIGTAELAGRWDLRDRPAITIDPVDARDFDDAVCAAIGSGSEIEVEVHIADVSHFVRRGTELDDAARDRGTSVYLPGRCVPMLPERVSSGLCTLAEGEDRLTYTVRFSVGRDGAIRSVEAAPAVIRSRRRCTYEEVFLWLETPRQRWPAEIDEFADSLELLAEAAERLGRARHARGSLDFELAEPELLLDPAGRVTAVRPSARNRAHRLIEELMVAANRCVAEMLIGAAQPALHRVHDRPDPDRVKALRQTLAELGYRLGGSDDDLAPAELQRILAEVAGRPEERLVSMLVLRTMARAVYSSDPRGHYALAADAYLHFTSPIRRYPDLVVHRMLRRLRVDGRPVAGAERERVELELAELGEHCSTTERRAEAAERMAVLWKTIHYLESRVGESFDGTVSGVTEAGLFVQLDEFLVDGLVHVSELLDDFYHYEEERHRLVGERTGLVWRLGDRIRVQLAGADAGELRLELVPVGEGRRDRIAKKRRGDSRWRGRRGR